MGEIVNFQQPAEGAVAEDPKLGEGYTRIVNELIEALAQANLASRHFRVMFAIIRQTYGWQKTRDRISSGQLASLTGMSRQNAYKAMRDLLHMNLIHRIDGSTVRINTRVATWNLEARPRQTRQGPPKSVTDGDDSQSETQSVNDGDDKTVTDGDDSTVNDGDDHKRKERKERQGAGSSTDDANATDRSKEQGTTTGSKRKADPVPYQRIVDLYHQILPELPGCVKLTDTRKRQIKARWHETYGQTPSSTLAFWARYLWFVKRSRFICGMRDNDTRNWRASLDFLTRQSSLVKAIEGQYHQQGDVREDLPEEPPEWVWELIQ